MNIAILGAGSMGKTHALAFHKQPDVKIIGVSSRRIEKARDLATLVGAETATTDDLALATDPRVDAVSITLPTTLHKEFTLAALQAGKDVLLEKPYALTLTDCDAMTKAWKKSGKILMLAQVLRFWSEYVALTDLVASGSLGKPRAATAARLSTRPRLAKWFQDPKLSGGAVMDLMVHDFDILNLIFGKPLRVFARGRKSRMGAWDHVLATIEYKNATATAEGTVMLPESFPFTMKLNVDCDRGAVEYIFRVGGADVQEQGETSLRVFTGNETYNAKPDGQDAYEAQIAYFLECVRTGQQPTRGTPVQARLAVAVSLAVSKALESGKIVTLS